MVVVYAQVVHREDALEGVRWWGVAIARYPDASMKIEDAKCFFLLFVEF
jgi:hypothetical protein